MKNKSFFDARIQERTDFFDISVQERIRRLEFFYNSFRALTFNGIDGDYAEFGCNGCITFALAYHEALRQGRNTHQWAFDSFQGLPKGEGDEDSHPFWVEGNLDTSLPKFIELCNQRNIPDADYTVVPGFYKETLPTFAPEDAPHNIALAYIDCDLYSSTCQVLDFLMPRLKHGMIIAFDDYFCWSSTHPSGERKAMLEYFGDDENKNLPWQLVPYMRFGWHGQSFVVENKSII